ncbi:hypothetical protein Ancab_002739 [Ancistrocladus abbreviatus]
MRTAFAPVNRCRIFSVTKNHHHQRSLLLTSQSVRLALSYSTSFPAPLRTLATARRRSPPMAEAASDNAAVDEAVKYGFERPEMYSSSLANTVDPPCDRHIFLCYKDYDSWPSRVEASETDLLPKLFSSALKARKSDIKVKTRLTICGGSDGSELSDGDVLIFPEMIKYRGLKDSDVEAFVDDVIVKGTPWTSGLQEALTGAFVFVCAHASRDKRCGVCGPVLIEKFKEEIKLRGLESQVFVNSCSHIGGHKYAGNLIVFGTNFEGKVVGDWYGYVTPNDVPDLIDLHIGKGEIIERLWRGQMGMYVEDAEKKPPKRKELEKRREKPQENGNQENKESVSSCCQGANGVSCCRDASPAVNGDVGDLKLKDTAEHGKRGHGSVVAWPGKWDQRDVLMAAAAVGAVATVAVAYSFYRRAA